MSVYLLALTRRYKFHNVKLTWIVAKKKQTQIRDGWWCITSVLQRCVTESQLTIIPMAHTPTMLTFDALNLFYETLKYIYIFISQHNGCGYLESFLWEDKDLVTVHNQWQGSCWRGDSRSQSISSHGIDSTLPEYFGFSPRKLKPDNYTCLAQLLLFYVQKLNQHTIIFPIFIYKVSYFCFVS